MIIRSVIHVMLAVLLFVGSTGFTVYEHYCRGELVSASLSKHNSDSCCAKKATKHKAPCCDDKVSLEQLESELIKCYDQDFEVGLATFDQKEFILSSEHQIVESDYSIPPFSDFLHERQQSTWTESYLL